MKANYVVYSDGIESMAYLDQERGVQALQNSKDFFFPIFLKCPTSEGSFLNFHEKNK